MMQAAAERTALLLRVTAAVHWLCNTAVCCCSVAVLKVVQLHAASCTVARTILVVVWLDVCT
jgi:hypothetical protein